MTLQPLTGGTHKKMEKFVALSTPNLLVSTLHRDDDDKVIPEDSDTAVVNHPRLVGLKELKMIWMNRKCHQKQHSTTLLVKL